MDKIIEKIKRKSKFTNKNVYEIDGDKYYRKRPYDEVNAINEIIAYELAKIVDIDVVKPYVYSNNGKLEIITKNFIPRGFVSISGKYLLHDYISYLVDNNLIDKKEIDNISYEEVLEKFNNLSDVWNALEYHMNKAYKKIKQDIIMEILRNLIKIFCFDILVLQTDRGCVNWEILESGNIDEFRLAPLFDNEFAFKNNKYLDSKMASAIKVTENNNEDVTLREILIEFLKNSEEEYKQIFISMFNKLDIDTFNDVINKVCENNKDIVSIISLNEIKEKYENNYNEIKNVLKELNLIQSEDDNRAR